MNNLAANIAATLTPVTTINYETSVDGRKYLVVVNPGKEREFMHEYIQVHRLKKDGSKGIQLAGGHKAYSAAYANIRGLIHD